MSLPIGLQLYTVRDALAPDFEGVIRKIAAMGYAGVETAGVFGKSVKDAAALFRELGLAVPAAHSPLPLGDKKNEVLDTIGTLGCKYLVLPWLSPDDFKTPDKIKAACAMINEGNAIARQHGLTVAYHNHDHEYARVDGRLAYEYMLDYLDSSVVFEIDTYWVQTAGPNPADVLRKLGKRAPLLHIKDGPCVVKEPMVAVGDGKMNFREVIDAAGDNAEWAIVELDQCATDMLTAVHRSFDYLVREELGHGRI